jgi:uncharacterized RmlC-like cupin family protein
MSKTEAVDWKNNGVRIIPGDSLDPNTPQTPGMTRAAAVNYARVGAQKIWAGTVRIDPNARTGAHHHGSLERPGDFIYIPPYVPHQEINALAQRPLECVIVRSDQEAIVVNLHIEPVEKPESVAWIDAIHRRT